MSEVGVPELQDEICFLLFLLATSASGPAWTEICKPQILVVSFSHDLRHGNDCTVQKQTCSHRGGDGRCWVINGLWHLAGSPALSIGLERLGASLSTQLVRT